MRKKVLLVQPIHSEGIELLEKEVEVIFASGISASTLRREIKGINGVIVRTAPFPGEIIQAADRLEVIGRHGVGVDNLEEPPPSDHPLFGLENIVLSPHMASLTRECVVTMARVVAQGVLDVLEGKRPQYIVNPDSLRNK